MKKGRQPERRVLVGREAGLRGSLEENEQGETDDREQDCRYQRIQEEAIVGLEVKKHARHSARARPLFFQSLVFNKSAKSAESAAFYQSFPDK